MRRIYRLTVGWPASWLGPAGDIKVLVVQETPGTRWSRNLGRYQQLGHWLDAACDANRWSNLMPHFATFCTQTWKRGPEGNCNVRTVASFFISPVPSTDCLPAYRFHFTLFGSCNRIFSSTYGTRNRSADNFLADTYGLLSSIFDAEVVRLEISLGFVVSRKQVRLDSTHQLMVCYCDTWPEY